MKQFVSASVPTLSVVGNHEWFDDSRYQFIAYKTRFSNPAVNGQRELYYSFDAGLVRSTLIN